MALSWTFINQALDYFAQCRTTSSFRTREEWLAAFPQRSEDEFEPFYEQLHKIQHQAYLLAEQLLDNEIDRAQATAQLSQMYPQLSERGLNWLISSNLHAASK